jgi:hypothetical protein
MAPRHLGSDSTRCDRLGNDPPLLLVAPPPAADDARNLRAPPNDLRVVIDVDHNVHTIRDPKRIAIMHARIALSYVRWEHRLRCDYYLGKSSRNIPQITPPSINLPRNDISPSGDLANRSARRKGFRNDRSLLLRAPPPAPLRARQHLNSAHRTVSCTDASHVACTSANQTAIIPAPARRPLPDGYGASHRRGRCVGTPCQPRAEPYGASPARVSPALARGGPIVFSGHRTLPHRQMENAALIRRGAWD